MRCDEFVELVTAHLEGTLDPATEQQFVEHLALCEGCDRYLEQFRRVAARTSGIRRPGSAALDLADVAAGRVEAFWEQRLSAWDIGAGTLLVREAGGVVTDFTGRNVGVEHTGVVAGNPAMHAWLLEVLR